MKAFKKLDSDKKVKVIILEGAGKGFSAGHNLKEVRGLKKREKYYVSNLSEAFTKYLGNGKIDDIDSHQLEISEIVKLAKNSKSLVFLAHPHTLMSNKLYSKSDNWINNEFHDYIESLKNIGIDGIEVYYPGYTHNTINTLLDICENQGLLASGGSDFHGHRKPNNLLGIGYENLPIKTFK